jgi:hypothetical protein
MGQNLTNKPKGSKLLKDTANCNCQLLLLYPRLSQPVFQRGSASRLSDQSAPQSRKGIDEPLPRQRPFISEREIS